MKKFQETNGVRRAEPGHEEGGSVWDCGSLLYDSYELVTFSHIVERHFMVLPYLSGSRDVEVHHSLEKGSSIKAQKPSVLCFLSQLMVQRDVLRRKRKIADGDRKEKSKKQKNVLSKVFPFKIISWKK